MSWKKNYIMKKLIILSLMAVCAAQVTTAQIKKGSISFGGTISGSVNTYMDGTGQLQNQTGGFQTLISVGKAIKTNTVLGINLGYSGTLNTSRGGSVLLKNRSHIFRAGVSWREYHKLARDFYFFSEAGASFSRAIQRSADSAGNSLRQAPIFGATIDLSTGVSYRLYKKLYVDLLLPGVISVDYNISHPQTPIGPATQGSLGVSSSLGNNVLGSLGVGLRFIF